jgi:carboxymethylenebutenolidase
MTELTIRASDGSGSFSAYASLPATVSGPGVLVIQEIFGVNGFIRGVCDYYASLGYLAVAPDLFWRIEAGLQLDPAAEADHNKAFELYGKLDMDKAIADLIATMKVMRTHETCTGKVGTVGFCLGGRLAYMMATRSDADANVGYYGVGIQDMLQEAKGITRPLMLHMPEDDKYVPPEAQAKIEEGLAGIPGVKLFRYPGADHAFARDGGQNYREDAAKLALERTVTMLATTLEQ